MLFGEEDADGGGDADDRATLVSEFAGLGVDPVGGHRVGVRSRGKQPSCIRAQVDVSRKSSAHGLDLDDLELSALRVGPVDRNAVVTAVR